MSEKETQVEEMEAASEEEQAEQAAASDGVDASEQLTAELQQAREQVLRQAAEFQNYRRRMEREYARQLQRGQIQVIEPMLNVLDDFRRSLDAAEQVAEQNEGGAAYDALKAGVELVYQNFSDVLNKLGVEYIEAVGQPFDEHLHEALMQQSAPEGTEPGTVLAEMQRGYRLGDRVLRHSRVIVAA
ncbi:MAG TPA: nucleotide exchange factor GrpE [Rhodothermales bacterium]|nr:nucleotide exchange factor GrpE [Rhodothermales bacterium]